MEYSFAISDSQFLVKEIEVSRNGDDFWSRFSRLDLSLSIMDRFWQLLMWLFVGGGGLLTAFLAKADPILKDLGPLYWVLVGVVTAVLIAFIFNLVKSAILKKEMANYYAAISVPRSSINPLSDIFSDLVIFVEDLRVPGTQRHKNKIFKRCKFVGPATIGISGGHIEGVVFNECGYMIAVQGDALLTGVVMLDNCTIQNCDFYSVTVLADQNTAREFKAHGINVSGLTDV